MAQIVVFTRYRVPETICESPIIINSNYVSAAIATYKSGQPEVND